MKKAFAVALAVLGVLSGEAAAPQVSNVTVAKDATSRKVTISYDLDQDAIVTAEILVDGQMLDVPKVWAGEVNRFVAAGTGKKIYWQGDIDWPLQSAAKLGARVTAWTKAVPPDYMAVKLFKDEVEEKCWYYASTNDIPGGVGDRRYKSDYLLLRRVPAKGIHWRMGNDSTRANPGANYQTHLVSFTKDFYVGVYEFTEAQFQYVGGSRAAGPYFSTYADSKYFPMTGVFYKNNVRGNVAANADVATDSILGKLRTLTGIKTFDLPTDAQWEFACRAGTATTLYDGTDTAYPGSAAEANMTPLAWWKDISGGVPHEVGLKKPNNWGLYDMLGNAAEWVRDCEHTYTATDDDENPLWTGSTFWRRGGSFIHVGFDVNSGSRNLSHGGWGGDGNKWTGFRVMCAVGE